MTGLEALRALARYETHGGYTWAALMDDGELVCVTCIRANYRQVFRSTRDYRTEGWSVRALAYSGESESTEHCAHCNKTLWEVQS